MFGGALAVGLPGVGGGIADAQNDDLRVHHNRIVGNGGSFTAGAVGVFAGAENYQIDHNDVCGNYSLEYGGGISHWGQSAGGRIQDNLVYYNDSIDSGGGITVAGDNTYTGGSLLGNGTGDDIVVERNTIEFNNSDDDGGGIFLLRPLEDTVLLQNNFINNNLAQDFGGGIALDDAADAFIINNTVAYNVSTSTAEDADRSSCFPGGAPPPGQPALQLPARRRHRQRAPQRGAVHAGDGSTFSDPVMFNNIIYQNEAYFWGATTEAGAPVDGVVLAGVIDLEVVDGGVPGNCLDPRESILTVDYGPDDADCTTTHASNDVGVDPIFVPGGFEDDEDHPVRGHPAPPRPGVHRRADQARRAAGRASAASPSCSTTTSSPTRRPSTPASTVDPTGSGAAAPLDDADGDVRPQPPGPTNFDQGADEVPSAPAVRLDLSLENLVQSLPVGGATVAVADEDVLTWDGTAFTMLFDGSDELGAIMGLLTDLDAFAAVGPNQFLVSFDIPVPGPLLGLPLSNGLLIDDADVLLFTATSLGPSTAGTWALYVDGSDVGLGVANAAEDIDGVAVHPSGKLLISTLGASSVPGVTSFGGAGHRRLHADDHRPGHRRDVGDVLRRERRRADHRRGERRRHRGGPRHPRHPLLHHRQLRRDRRPRTR